MPDEGKLRLGAQSPGAAMGKVEIRLLGRLTVLVDGASVVLPKKVAGLLAFLGAHPGQSISRERLATLFWGDRATEQARQSLRQGLVALRQAFSGITHEAFRIGRETVSLVPPSEWIVDTVLLDAALATDDPVRLGWALDLWRGAFLAEFDAGLEPFEEWLLIERERRAQQLSKLLLKLTTHHLERGNFSEAESLARRLVAHDPLREDGHRLLIETLMRQGMRGAALGHYEALTRLLADELGIEPDTRTQELAGQIRKGESGSSPIPENESGSRMPGLPPPGKPSIAVIPIINLTGKVAFDAAAQALTDDLIDALGREKGLFVIAQPSAATFSARNADIREAGRLLGVAYVLRGSLRQLGSTFGVAAILSDAETGAFVASYRIEDTNSDLSVIVDRLTSLVGARIAPELRALAVRRIARKPVTDLSAYELYLRAMSMFRRDLASNRAAIDLLDSAISIDPDFAVAHALTARCYQFQKMMGWVNVQSEELQKGILAARHAIELGPDDAEVLWMASHAFNLLAGDADHAFELISRALDLNPSAANAWTTSCSVHTMLGEFETAIAHFEQGQRLNPLDRSQHLHWNVVGLTLFALNRIEDASQAADRALRHDPLYPQALRLKIATLGACHDRQAAKPFLDRLISVHPSFSCQWLEEFWSRPMSKIPSIFESLIAASKQAGVPDQPNSYDHSAPEPHSQL